MADAPRFRAYFEFAEGRPVVHMPRDDWNELNVSSSRTALIDIRSTPMASVASNASVVAAYGHRFSNATAEVGIVRLDLTDDPYVYNMDKYLAWLDLPSHRSFAEMVTAASTEDNDNLRQYLHENVLLVKQAPDGDHHRRELPETLRILLDSPDI